MMANTTTHVWVTARFPGFHRWPDAPERTAYLRTTHRHLFHVTAEVCVPAGAEDRAVEFHDLLDWLEQAWHALTLGTGGNWIDFSCEQIAVALTHKLWPLLEVESLAITVSEDGECGARVTTNSDLFVVGEQARALQRLHEERNEETRVVDRGRRHRAETRAADRADGNMNLSPEAWPETTACAKTVPVPR